MGQNNTDQKQTEQAKKDLGLDLPVIPDNPSMSDAQKIIEQEKKVMDEIKKFENGGQP